MKIQNKDKYNYLIINYKVIMTGQMRHKPNVKTDRTFTVYSRSRLHTRLMWNVTMSHALIHKRSRRSSIYKILSRQNY